MKDNSGVNNKAIVSFLSDKERRISESVYKACKRYTNRYEYHKHKSKRNTATTISNESVGVEK